MPMAISSSAVEFMQTQICFLAFASKISRETVHNASVACVCCAKCNLEQSQVIQMEEELLEFGFRTMCTSIRISNFERPPPPPSSFHLCTL